MSFSEKENLKQILNSIKSQKSKQPNTREELALLVEAYNTYKTNYGKNIQFDPDNENFCKYESNDTYASSFLFTASIIPPASLQMVEIYFDTATYDEIKRDVKVTIKHIFTFLCTGKSSLVHVGPE